jgi:hypothetical protein
MHLYEYTLSSHVTHFDLQHNPCTSTNKAVPWSRRLVGGLSIRLHPVVFRTIKGQQFRLTQHIKWDQLII